MNNPIYLLSSGNPDTGKTVEVYTYDASDSPGGVPNGSKVGDALEYGSTGLYEFEHSGACFKGTVVSDGVCRAGLIGVALMGEKLPDNSVETSMIQDNAVTPNKASFVEEF